MADFVPNESEAVVDTNVDQVGVAMRADLVQEVPPMELGAVQVGANIESGEPQVDASVDVQAVQLDNADATEANLFGDVAGGVQVEERSIIHFTDDMNPSEDLFHSLQFMPIWVKIIGLPFSYLTIAVGRKLLAKLGEVMTIGYFDADTPEGTYLKGRVRMDLLDTFLGTTPVFRPNVEYWEF
ncbi:hypothetical protein LINPERHAP1_LOCUS37677 [Linum perenne]